MARVDAGLSTPAAATATAGEEEVVGADGCGAVGASARPLCPLVPDTFARDPDPPPCADNCLFRREAPLGVWPPRLRPLLLLLSGRCFIVTVLLLHLRDETI